MRIRRRPSPLLLLLLPSLANCLVPASSTPALVKNAATPYPAASPLGSPESVLGLRQKGTKDAPVDGKDGKPHAGPWVDTPSEKERTQASPVVGGAELVLEAKPTRPALKNAPSDPTIIDGVRIPETNDGVMDDPNRQLPKVGTTGTEGGVSEKDKARKAHEGQTGERLEQVPATPKEAPPLPHSEQAKLDSHLKGAGKGDKDVDAKSDSEASLAGLEKPSDLPDKPHDIPHPVPDSANKDHLDISKPSKSGSSSTDTEEGNEGLIQPLHSYILSMSMILVSEVGDKTFLVAALMAMKHDRLLVFSAAFSALIAMTVLSAVLGHAVPTLLPKRFTNFAAAILFLIFGARLLREGLAMSPDEGVQDEMQEVEQELREKEHQAKIGGRRRSSVSPYALESGMGRTSRQSRSASRLPSPPRSPSSSPERAPRKSAVSSSVSGLYNLLALLLSPAWMQTFVMTFLGEWGDRSQIATIAMAAGQDYWWVTAGAVSGHAVCTGVAVIGGRAIAGKVSMRVVTLGGAIAFLVFGVIYSVEALYFG